MITVYHLAHSRSERIVWLLEELQVPYALEVLAREPQPFAAAAPASALGLHPVGKFPIVRDGDDVLVESGAIIELLLHRYGGGRLKPAADSPAFARYVQWMHFAEGGAMHQFVMQYTVDRMPGVEASAFRDWITATTLRYRRYIEAELGTRPYIAGDEFSAADIQMPLAIAFMQSPAFQSLEIREFPNCRVYLERIGARAAYRKAMTIANPA